MNAITTISTFREAELLDKIEAQNYLTTYFRFDYNGVMNSNSIETLLSARTTAHKVQLYAALADAAQSCGDFQKGRAFIGQARSLSGSIYDSIDVDSVKGLMMMRKYYYHTLNFTQCTHYSGIAWSIARLVKGMEPKIKMFTQFSANMSDFTTNNAQKREFLREMLVAHNLKGTISQEARLFGHYASFAVDFLTYFDFNIFFPAEESVTTIFKDMKHVHLDEKVRLRMLECVNAVQIEISSMSTEECTSLVLLNRVKQVFCPMYQMLINWKSGHIAEAMANALSCVSAFDALRSLNAALTNTNLLALVVGYTHICMLGSLIQFFAEQGQYKMAERVESHITAVCKTRGPEYDAILAFMEEFRKNGFILPPDDNALINISPTISRSSTIITPLSPDDPEILKSPSPASVPTPPLSCNSPPTPSPIPSPSPASSSSISSSSLSSSLSSEDLDAQLNALKRRVNSDNLNPKYALDIDISKPLTPQLLEQLRTINLSAQNPRYEGEGLKVNNVIVFKKEDPSITYYSTNEPSSNQRTVYNNNNNNTNTNYDNSPPQHDIYTVQDSPPPQSNGYINIQDQYQNFNNNQQTRYHPSGYQLHPSLQQQSNHHSSTLYHTSYQPIQTHPSSQLSHSPQPHHSPHLSSQSFQSQTPHSHPHPHSPSHYTNPPPPQQYSNTPPNPTFVQSTNPNYGNFAVPIPTINGNLETQQDVLNLLDQFLCPPGTSEGFIFGTGQDHDMVETRPQ